MDEYVALCRRLAERTVGSVDVLERAGAPAGELEPVLRWLADVSRQVDQVERRLLNEKIPHSEKVFSVSSRTRVLWDREAGQGGQGPGARARVRRRSRRRRAA